MLVRCTVSERFGGNPDLDMTCLRLHSGPIFVLQRVLSRYKVSAWSYKDEIAKQEANTYRILRCGNT